MRLLPIAMTLLLAVVAVGATIGPSRRLVVRAQFVLQGGRLLLRDGAGDLPISAMPAAVTTNENAVPLSRPARNRIAQIVRMGRVYGCSG
jgi:hypothetical protein